METESYDLIIDDKTYEIEINRNEELLWCNKECLSFVDAIFFFKIVLNFDYSGEGFKPHYVPVFKLKVPKDELISIVDYFDIDR